MKYTNNLRGDSFKFDIFKKAYDHAKMYTTCNKLPVGSIILVPNKETDSFDYYFGSNSNYSDNGEYNCQKLGECHKAKVTGIYESCEETRKYCKAIHSEINAIADMKYATRNHFDEKVKDAIMFITRYPCVNCAKAIVESGIKSIKYCGIQEISDEVKKIFNDANVLYDHYPQYDFEEENFVKNYQWWTNEFSDKAYDIVKDRKFPVTIPGYNRPALPTLWNFGVDKFTDDKNWDFIVIVRESQYDMYMEATKTMRKWVTIKSFPDDIINNAGAVRRTTQKWLNSLGIEATFQMDDDVQYLGWSFAGRKGDGYPKSKYCKYDENHNVCDTLAMWQIAMEKAMKEYDIFISCGQQIAFSWKEDYCWKETSMKMMCGPMTQVVCFNIKRLCEENIYHNNNVDVGFDDIDFTIRVINSGHKVCCFPWLVYGCEALGGGNGDKVSADKLKERFKKNQDTLKANHSDKSFVKFRPKRGLDQCCLSFGEARRYLNRNYDYPESMIRNNNIDIWEDGGLLK